MNDSILSSASIAHPSLGRVVANVVDMQSQLVNQFDTIAKSLEALKITNSSAVELLREDIRRLEDRSQKQLDELRISRDKESERLHILINNLMNREPAQQRYTPAQNVYAAAASPSNFFGAPMAPSADMQRQMMMMNQDPQLIQRMLMQMSGLAPQTAANAGIFNSAPAPGSFNNVPAAANSGLATAGAPSMVTAPKQYVPVVAPPAATVTPPKPIAGIVNLPVTASPKAATPVPIVAVKKEESPSGVVATPLKPIFGINAETGFGSVAPNIFGKVTPASPLAKSIFGTPKAEPIVLPKTDQKQNEVEDADDEPENYEPQVDFKPVIPLPELVNVVTGEEGEEVVFESRCKLYRYAESKEWKERGTGIIKILKNKDTAKSRVVMRREQVHKICANHSLVAGMKISKMPKNEKALVWICKDFTDDVEQLEQFSAKFSSVELADEFKSAFEGSIPLEDSKKDTSSSDIPAVKSTSTVPVSTQKSDDKISESAQPQGFGDKFKMKEGEWDCTGCYTRQPAEKNQCDCCFTNKDGTQGEKNIFKPMTAPAPGASKFSFGLAAAVAAKDDVPPVTTKAGIFGSQAISTAPKFSFGTAGSPSTSIFGGNKPSTELNATPKFSFVKKEGTTAPAASTPTTSTSTASPVTFSFKSATSTPTPLFGGKNIFGQSALGSGETKAETETIPKSDSEPAKVFGSGFASGLSFNSVAKSNASIFSAENTEKAKAEFANLPKSKLAAPIKKDEAAEGDDEGDDEDDVEKEPDVEFAPVVPLPDLVEVVTGEEREEVVFKERAKLFRFDRELGQNKERGTGDIKILRNPDTGKYRVVMRREQVHKLCANFHITSDLKISPKPNMPNVYMWSCMDYAEVEGGSYETLTVKFKNEQMAKQFHDEFVNAQK